MELNKVVAAFCSTLLVFLGLGFFSELIFNSHKSEELAYMLEVEEADSGEAVVDVDLTAVFAAADPAKGEKVFKKCAACHKLEDGANATGPYLYGVVNRDVDSAKGYTTYSGALPVGEKWTRENLFHFLESPKKFAPGTTMGFAGLRKVEDRADVIAYLNEADGSPDPLP